MHLVKFFLTLRRNMMYAVTRNFFAKIWSNLLAEADVHYISGYAFLKRFSGTKKYVGPGKNGKGVGSTADFDDDRGNSFNGLGQ
jgi:hypothetical protein